MVAFNCLSRDCPLFGPHLLEASAGTGKTFSIEHIYVRFVLEAIDVEQILVVTFTRAATRELKTRIRMNLEKALSCLVSKNACWDYLIPYFDSEESIRYLTDALAGFDRCQIFTIHGFCYRVLKEFAFEAKLSSLSDPDERKGVPEQLRHAAFDFLENGIDEDLLCPEQVGHLLKQFNSVEEIVDQLVKLEEGKEGDSFSAIASKCKAAIHNPINRGDLWGPPDSKCKAALHLRLGAPKDESSLGLCIAALHLEVSKLLDDFRALEKNYKTVVKGDFEAQVRALAHLEDPSSVRILLKEKGSLFDYLSPSNRKVRAEEPPFLHYPGFFDWAREELGPLFKQKPFPILQAAWNPIGKKILAEVESFDPDEILAQMKKAVEKESFASLIRKKFQAAIIDEFQDTDAVQWDIFHKLFLEAEPLKALYLVGDPKQSIYRFRKADVYTYLKARDLLGENHLYQLDTNFRSSKNLIGALNALFNRDWLHLPKVNRTIPYHPVKAGAKIESNFPDEKGALHFFIAEGEPSLLFDEVFLPYAVAQIEQLHLKNCAILVKDRFQTEKALAFLKSRQIPAVARSHTPLGKTPSFQAVRELFEAILSPTDSSAAKIVMTGPFAQEEIPFAEYKALLKEKGLVPFARMIFQEPPASDIMQIFELLFAWEKSEGFSFEGLMRYLQKLGQLEPEEGGRRRMEVDEEAVQVMTLHISKGLEFDVVFALGLISRTPEGEEREELDAEKLRQLYVAMTRAKKRLYVPFALSKKDPDPGTHSPLELFARQFEGPLLEQLSQIESITYELLCLPLILPPVSPIVEKKEILPVIMPRSYTPSYLSSFTMLAKTKEVENLPQMAPQTDLFTLQTMPRGAETGIVIHRIFESIFSKGVWRNPLSVNEVIKEEIRFSSLVPWESAIQEMVQKTLRLPLQAEGEFFSLIELEKNQLQVEVEFVYPRPPDFIKGFIDLVCWHRGKVYLVDWKTNWLEDYTEKSLEKAMLAHDYALQAALYSEAIQRHFNTEYRGAFYLFVRGGAVKFIGKCYE